MAQTFRTQESIEAEGATRDLVVPFLRSIGSKQLIETRKQSGTAVSQAVEGNLPSGTRVRIKVKLCWRRGRSANTASYSAAQLIAKVNPGEAESKVRSYAARAEREGFSHLLLLQSDHGKVIIAVLVPFSELGEIWTLQRDLSAQLIAEGKMGRRTKNHAENGHSPTIYLQDDAAPKVADLLLTHHGVVDLRSIQLIGTQSASSLLEDTLQDTVIPDYGLLGNDSPSLSSMWISYVNRDNKVRLAVLARAKGRCERPNCGNARLYPGFLDVHHVLGVENSDRVWTCVALCPNCHREAHISPQSLQLNNELLQVASRYQ